MSYEAFGDGDSDRDGYVTDERAEELFINGARAMREMLARFIEQDGDVVMANSIRQNWVPSWGKDPGQWEGDIPQDCWST